MDITITITEPVVDALLTSYPIPKDNEDKPLCTREEGVKLAVIKLIKPIFQAKLNTDKLKEAVMPENSIT